jgi:hypothetical protein
MEPQPGAGGARLRLSPRVRLTPAPGRPVAVHPCPVDAEADWPADGQGGQQRVAERDAGHRRDDDQDTEEPSAQGEAFGQPAGLNYEARVVVHAVILAALPRRRVRGDPNPDPNLSERGRRVGVVQILGLAFAGTATDQRAEMARFVLETLGLEPVQVGGVDADMFALPDRSHFAVADRRRMGETTRSIGFRVETLDEAVAELRAAGVEVDEPAENERQRYVHFRAPDGKLYELVEELRRDV